MPNVVAGDKIDQFLVGSWFSLEMPKANILGITEVSGLSTEVNVVEITQVQGAAQTSTKKRPGAAKYGEITVKRPLTADKSLWQWAKDIRDGKNDYRADGSIVLHDITNKEVGRYNFTNAWPSKWSASDLDVGTDDAMIEECTFQIEFIERVS